MASVSYLNGAERASVTVDDSVRKWTLGKDWVTVFGTCSGRKSRNSLAMYREDSNLARVPLPKWIFDVEIEKLRAEFFLHVKKTKITLSAKGKLLIDSSRPTFYNFISTFPELTFHDF